MNEKNGVTHDTAARLIGLSPADLEKLVRDGSIHRNDKNSYSVPVLVADYVAYLKAQIAGTAGHPKQIEVGAHLDLSERSVRDWESKLGLPSDYTMADFRLAYIGRLREEAAGRAADGDLDLATERAGLAKAQREKIEMQNAVTRKELAPVYLLEEVLARAGGKVSKILDTIPGTIRRREPSLSAATIAEIARDVAKVRNIAAALTLDDLMDDEQADAQPDDEPTEQEQTEA
jgi:phage terminase Nu1 subunit (DNA packaging protein)